MMQVNLNFPKPPIPKKTGNKNSFIFLGKKEKETYGRIGRDLCDYGQGL
jgi:hypothetical protein